MSVDDDLLAVRTDVRYAPTPNVVVLVDGRLAGPASAVPVTSACAIVSDAAGRVLLTCVAARGYDLPGGHVEPGETPEQASRREIAEETGLRLDPDVPLTLRAALHLEIAAPAPPGYGYPWPRAQMWVFVAGLAGRGGAVAPMPGTECTHARWVDATELAELCGTRTWYPAVRPGGGGDSRERPSGS